ncbi:F-box domain-containingprotein [Purpureocillium lilacinum]|uniref:F-box domain-containingprotein n=1 Tax=Purpureocillium lilacinum TaxID=33203 RepID=A0A179GHW1_PURLI|nr:F-box domain-containingprotein [Purpureocillium lilacinum]
MRLPFRRKDKKKSESSSSYPEEFRPWPPATTFHAPPTYRSAQLLDQFSHALLQRIFAFVCPHTRDESYDPCEESAGDDGCMLCDLRDLSHCAQVNRTWRASAVTILYHSVRIDPVHYCKLEAFLAEKRKKTSRFDRNGIPEDPALARLRLFRRTVRDDPTRIGKLVQFLKTPYMIRESCHVELAQTIAVLPNLKYVDLPEGMFADEPNYATLRLEVQARCPNLRKMSYVKGSERSFAALAQPQVWPCLEVLELDRLDVDPMVLRNVLGSLTRLRALKVTETPSFSDEVMVAADSLPPMPALEELVVKDAPRMTVAGLVEYLSWYETQSALRVLTLKDTGVQPWRLQEVLQMAPALRTLAIQAKVQDPFPTNESPALLSSKRLKTLRYEISSTSGAGPYATPGYYTYLASCIMSGNLPRLRRLYVRDESFPDKLSGLPPPQAAFSGRRPGSSSSNASPPAVRVSPLPVQPPRSPTFPSQQPMSPTGNPNRFSSNNPFAQPRAGPFPPTQTLEVFTKNDEYGKWNFARVDSFTAAETGGHGDRRPMSSYGLAADVTGPGWDRGEARRSVLIGNGTSGFLAVPGGTADAGFTLSAPPKPFANAARPRSSGGEPTRSRGHWK